MKTETLRAVNPFYKRVGEQYLAKEKAKENVVEEGSQFQKSNKIAVPNLLRYSFLDGEFGKKVHDEVVSKYSGFDFFDKIKYNSEKRVVEGSNPFYVVAVNEILREYGLRTANQADLEKIIKTDALPLGWSDQYTALILRSVKGPNGYLARDLMAQILTRDIKAKLPVMIPLTEFDLAEDNDSPQRLRFNLRDSAEIIYAPVLNQKGALLVKDLDKKTGLPKKLSKTFEGRYFDTGDSGLSSLQIGLYLKVHANCCVLNSGFYTQRVVVVNEKMPEDIK